MNKGVLGDVKYSILKEDEFRHLNGESWIPADGRNIEGSDLHKITGMSSVPDARGMFVRAMGGSERPDDYREPESRGIGSLQQDTTRVPRKAFEGTTSESGSHTHAFNTAGIWNRSFSGASGTPRTAHFELGDTLSAGNHRHEIRIEKGGDEETRPKNIAFYLYIKINNQ